MDQAKTTHVTVVIAVEPSRAFSFCAASYYFFRMFSDLATAPRGFQYFSGIGVAQCQGRMSCRRAQTLPPAGTEARAAAAVYHQAFLTNAHFKRQGAGESVVTRPWRW